MSIATLLEEIEKLPVSERLFIVEKTIHALRAEKSDTLALAAEELAHEYKTNKELTIFSSLDIESFYEPR